MKSLIENGHLEYNPTEECFIKPEKLKLICENQSNVISINGSKTINNIKADTNSYQVNKFKKQMLLNGDIVNDFHFKKVQRRNRSCNHLNKSKQRGNSNLDLLWANVRRSERCPEKILKNKKELMILNSIKNNREEGMRIIQTKDKGRGVESTTYFEKDSFVIEYAGDLMSEKEAREKEMIYKKDPNKGSYMFYFKFKEMNYCVDATEESGKLGRLLNHSKLNPNCYVKVIPINNVPRLTIFAKREIEIGEELLYDYGDRDKETLEANPWLKF